jgi:hypothetical protein
VAPQGWTGSLLGVSGGRDSLLCRSTGGIHEGSFGKTIGARTGTPKFAQLTDRDPARRNRPAPERPKHNLARGRPFDEPDGQ